MDGIHDLGGMSGFGAVEVEGDEPVFHEPWQALAFALNILGVTLGTYNVDEYRHAVERMDPAHYLSASYYERVLTGAATLFVEKGVVTQAQLERAAAGPFPLARPVAETPTWSAAAPGHARFVVGAQVRARDIHPTGHTRIPRYVRGKSGVILHVAPPFSFPDEAAHGSPLRPEHTYHVEFSASDLWTDATDAGESVVVDLWDSYLEPA